MSDEQKKVKGFVPKTFKDAGTGETFEGGKEHSFTPGAYGNYHRAGLIGEPPAAKTDATAQEPAKGKAA